jgi:hypothetical protein
MFSCLRAGSHLFFCRALYNVLHIVGPLHLFSVQMNEHENMHYFTYRVMIYIIISVLFSPWYRFWWPIEFWGWSSFIWKSSKT